MTRNARYDLVAKPSASMFTGATETKASEACGAPRVWRIHEALDAAAAKTALRPMAACQASAGCQRRSVTTQHRRSCAPPTFGITEAVASPPDFAEAAATMPLQHPSGRDIAT